MASSSAEEPAKRAQGRNSVTTDDADAVLDFLGFGDLGVDSSNGNGTDQEEETATKKPELSSTMVQLCVTEPSWYMDEEQAAKWGLAEHPFRDVQTNLAQSHLLAGRYREAETIWQGVLKALEENTALRPKKKANRRIVLRENMARCAYARGDFKYAVELMAACHEEARFTQMMRPARLAFMAECYRGYGDIDSAIKVWLESTAKDFDVITCVNLLQGYTQRITSAQSADILDILNASWIARGTMLILRRDMGTHGRVSFKGDIYDKQHMSLQDILDFHPRTKSLNDILRCVVSVYYSLLAQDLSTLPSDHPRPESPIPQTDAWESIIEQVRALPHVDKELIKFYQACQKKSQIGPEHDEAVEESGREVSSSAARAGFDPMAL